MSSGDYTDAGATADDLDDGDLTEQIVIVNGVDVLSPDTYFVTYNVTDSDGNEAEEVIRSITVIDDIAPIITLTEIQKLLWNWVVNILKLVLLQLIM